jgi:hypothetical protein
MYVNNHFPTIIGGYEELIVVFYLTYDINKPPPTKDMRYIIDYSYSRKQQLILGCNTNAHRILWGRTNTNPREKSNGKSGEFKPKCYQSR